MPKRNYVRDIPTIRAGRQINFFNFWYAIHTERAKSNPDATSTYRKEFLTSHHANSTSHSSDHVLPIGSLLPPPPFPR